LDTITVIVLKSDLELGIDLKVYLEIEFSNFKVEFYGLNDKWIFKLKDKCQKA